jgi:hypothetical protein
MASTELVQLLQTNAEQVTRQLPEAHVLTRWFRESKFRDATEEFVRVLYRVDVFRLSEAQLEAVQHWTRVVQKAVELHMLLKYTPQDTAECGYAGTLVTRLRDAVEALDAGLPADPAKRPTDEEMAERFATGLRAANLL